MIKITNDVLAERIDNLSKSIDNWREDFKEEILPEIKENTKLRNQFKGVVGTISFIAAAFGGAIVWLFNKITK